MSQKQINVHPAEKDYGYIKYLRQSLEMAPQSHPPRSEALIWLGEAQRDYFTESLRQINHLIQIDQKPNLELMEPRWELYKISISFQHIGKFNRIIKWGASSRWSFPPNFTRSSRDDNHREDAPHFIYLIIN